MHDIRAIRKNSNSFDQALARRGLAPLSSDILSLDTARRNCIQAAEAASADQNAAAKLVGAAKSIGDTAEFNRLRTLIAAKKTEVANLNGQAKEKDAALVDLLMGIPNLPYEDTPDAHPKLLIDQTLSHLKGHIKSGEIIHENGKYSFFSH